MGASVSAGFGGMSFEDAFKRAAPRSQIHSEADVLLFRDPLASSARQLDAVIAWKPTAVIALDFLFWDVYGSRDPAWRTRALSAALAGLDRARAAGAWIVIGDVPRIVTAAEWMLSPSSIPTVEELAAINATIRGWTDGRDRVLFVPFASWTEPLARGGEIELRSGERVPAATLMALDGLHANAVGVWVLLDRLDQLIETTHAGTDPTALEFKRPAP